jgi:hypothetical protein
MLTNDLIKPNAENSRPDPKHSHNNKSAEKKAKTSFDNSLEAMVI